MPRIAIYVALVLCSAGCGRRPASTGGESPEVERQFAGLWSVGPEQPNHNAYPTYLRMGIQRPTELLCGSAAGCYGGALGPATYVALPDGRTCTFGLDYDSQMAPTWQSQGNDRLIFESFCEPGPHVSLEFVFRTAPAGNASADGARVELERIDGRPLADVLGADGVEAFRWWRFRRCVGDTIEDC